jgi:hypothetical protein
VLLLDSRAERLPASGNPIRLRLTEPTNDIPSAIKLYGFRGLTGQQIRSSRRQGEESAPHGVGCL